MGCDHSKKKEGEGGEQERSSSSPSTSSEKVNETNESNSTQTTAPSHYRGVRLFQRSDFTIENFIQEGGQGKVYVGRHNATEKLYALKVSQSTSFQSWCCSTSSS